MPLLSFSVGGPLPSFPSPVGALPSIRECHVMGNNDCASRLAHRHDSFSSSLPLLGDPASPLVSSRVPHQPRDTRPPSSKEGRLLAFSSTHVVDQRASVGRAASERSPPHVLLEAIHTDDSERHVVETPHPSP